MSIFDIKNNSKAVSLIPKNNKVFHIIGIGGIGMSAIAHVLIEHDCLVQGSDLNQSNNIKNLEEKKCKCFIGPHKKENIENADIIIHSSAINDNNVEMQEAKRLGKIILNRAQILNHIIYSSYNIAISGMHGKTTTSSMMASIFEDSGVKHLAMIGGIMERNKSNYMVHKNFEWSVIEADESDDTFIKIPYTIALITNISPEHLDFHLTFENIKRKFKKFIEQVPFFGFSVICSEEKQMIDFISDFKKEFPSKNIITYAVLEFMEDKSENSKINYLAKNIVIHDLNKITFDVFHNSNTNASKFLGNFELNIFGKFNISNALACIAVSNELSIDLDDVRNALKNFRTTKRRFDIIGEISENVLLIDDYAHHPKEINANIETAKILAEKRNGKLIVIMQPHRNSRVQKLFDCFINSRLLSADSLGILPIYSAGECEIQGISSEVLNQKINELKEEDEEKAEFLGSFDELSNFILRKKRKNDIVLFLGAGDISKMAYEFFKKYKD